MNELSHELDYLEAIESTTSAFLEKMQPSDSSVSFLSGIANIVCSDHFSHTKEYIRYGHRIATIESGVKGMVPFISIVLYLPEAFRYVPSHDSVGSYYKPIKQINVDLTKIRSLFFLHRTLTEKDLVLYSSESQGKLMSYESVSKHERLGFVLRVMFVSPPED